MTGQRELDEYEQCARDRLEPVLGPWRQMDPGGGPGGQHDFEVNLAGGGFAAIEVTGEVEADRRELESLVKRLPAFTVPGSLWRWQVGLRAGVRQRRVSSGLVALLTDMEKAGRRHAHYREDYRDPLVQRLRDLGVEFVYAWVPTDPAHRGSVILGPGTYAGWEWGLSGHRCLAGGVPGLAARDQ